jgi:hypothetical protein
METHSLTSALGGENFYVLITAYCRDINNEGKKHYVAMDTGLAHHNRQRWLWTQCLSCPCLAEIYCPWV